MVKKLTYKRVYYHSFNTIEIHHEQDVLHIGHAYRAYKPHHEGKYPKEAY